MENHGKLLLKLIKAKGFNIQGIADQLPKTTVAVQRDIKQETLTRKVISRYSIVLDFNVDDFFNGKLANGPLEVTTPANKEEVKLLRQLVEEQSKRLELQDRMIRFFPNAVQRA